MTDDSISNELKDIRRQVEELITDDKSEAAIVDAVMRFPGLVGFWPMSVTNSSGEAVDVSGNGLHLTNNSSAVFHSVNDTVGRVKYDGAADYHSHVDAADFDITGTETFINNNGITFGAWFFIAAAGAGGTRRIMAKRSGSGSSSSYALTANSSDKLNGFVTESGTLSTLIATSTSSLINDSWQFCCFKFGSGADVSVFLNDEKTTTSTSGTTINNSSAPFTIGANGAPGEYLDGSVSLAFLCTSAVSDTQINDFYELSRPKFNV